LTVPATALEHFTEDVRRARAILIHAVPLPATSASEEMLRSDLFRSAWMFAVGALDAYFCDAYTDIVASALSSKSRQATVTLPDFFYEIRLPVRAILEEYTKQNWRWRMAARKMMERENVLSLETVKGLFNKFFRPAHKFFNDLLDTWMARGDAKIRLFGVTRTQYVAMNAGDQDRARRAAIDKMSERFAEIFQRRHDCIHNCDRPKSRPKDLLGGTVLKVIQDVEFLVYRCDEHINAEFREFLTAVGCNAATITAAGY
jgi:hypothetical protein